MDIDDNFIWLTAGRVVAAKDYPNLLRAFAQVVFRQQTARLWIAGEADATDWVMLEAMARQPGIAGKVQWLGLCRDLPALLDASDAFVLASAWEGMPLALGEAMAMAKPVVATDVGGVREMAGRCGSIVPARNSEALAEAMLGIIEQSDDLRHSLGEASRQRILHHFNMDFISQEWESLYASLLSR